MSIKEKQS